MDVTPEIKEAAEGLMSFLAVATRKLDSCQEALGSLTGIIKSLNDELEAHKEAIESLYENDSTLGKRDDILKARMDSHADKINNMGLAIESLELKLNN